VEQRQRPKIHRRAHRGGEEDTERKMVERERKKEARAIPGLGFPNWSIEKRDAGRKSAQVVEKEGGEGWRKIRKIGTRLA
jgi:hypothetical protein